MKILIIYDGKPGHLSQSQGLANVIKLRSSKAVEVKLLSAKPRLKLLNSVLRKLAPIPSAWLCRVVIACYKFIHIPSKPDLIISFGGNSVALNVALKYYFHANNIAIGNCYSIPSECFDAQVSISGDDENDRAVSSKIPICKVDKQQRIAAGRVLSGNSQKNWSMLIGGDGSGYCWQEQDFHRIGRALRVLSHQYGVRWLLTTSRRTPLEAEKILGQYLNEDNVQTCYFFHQQKSGDILAILGSSERIFCTEDSLSMITESVALEKPVVTIKPENITHKEVHQSVLLELESNRLIERYSISEVYTYMPAQYQPLKSYNDYVDELYIKLEQVMKRFPPMRSEPSITSLGSSEELTPIDAYRKAVNAH